MEDLRYPVGNFTFDTEVAESDYPDLMETIASAPTVLRKTVSGLTDKQLDTPYRDGGWTGRQVVHHLADSHMNAYCRTKLSLTESEPAIKPYDEAAWAELPDSKAPVELSLNLLDALHDRWVRILKGVPPSDLRSKGYFHPDHGRVIRLDQMLALYAWHGRHHTAHISNLMRRAGW